MLISTEMIENYFEKGGTKWLVVLFTDIKAGMCFDTSALDLDTTYAG